MSTPVMTETTDRIIMRGLLDNMTVQGKDNTTDNSSITNSSLCQDEFPRAIIYYRGLKDNVAETVLLALCCVVTLVTFLIYLSEIWSKQYRSKVPGKRLKTLLLLGVYPLTCFMACFALLVPRSTVLVDLVATCYLSLCIYVFIAILIQYYGSTDTMLEKLKTDKISTATPPCCCCCCWCLPKITINRTNLNRIRILIMQVAIVQPTCLFIRAVIWSDDNASVDENGAASPLMYLNLLSGVSTILSLYGLSVAVSASEIYLSKHKIKAKFTVLQFVLVFTNLQQAIFGIFADKLHLPPCDGIYGSKVRGSVIHHMMVVVQMFLLALLASFLYRKSETRNLSDMNGEAPNIDLHGHTTTETEATLEGDKSSLALISAAENDVVT